MKKNILLLLALLCSITITQAQKNKKQANPASATTDDKGWKPTKGDTRNPFDTAKTKQVKANGLSEGDDPFGKKGKLKGELTTYKNSNERSRKNGAYAKNGVASLSPYSNDSLKLKPVKANGLGEGEDPFGKTGGRRKKTTTKQSGYANQEVNYIKPGATTTQTTPKPVKGKKQVKPVAANE